MGVEAFQNKGLVCYGGLPVFPVVLTAITVQMRGTQGARAKPVQGFFPGIQLFRAEIVAQARLLIRQNTVFNSLYDGDFTGFHPSLGVGRGELRYNASAIFISDIRHTIPTYFVVICKQYGLISVKNALMKGIFSEIHGAYKTNVLCRFYIVLFLSVNK